MVVISSFSPPTEGIKHEQPFTTVYISDREIGKGTLFITESRLSWVNSCSEQGFSLEYPHIALHAVSRDLQAHPHECLYIMVDAKIDGPECYEEENAFRDASEEESDPGMTEIRFIPDDKGMLDAMFHAMSECQALHPDPQDSFSDDEEIYEDADDEEGEYQLGGGDAAIIGNAPNGVRMEEEPMEMEVGQFEDAEGDPDN